MKIKILLILLFLLTSCKSYLVNQYFKRVGVYDDKIKLEKLNNNDKEIILFGMHHIGKKEFYKDVESKIDSLTKKDYLFYVEGISSEFSGKTDLTAEDSTILIDLAYKFRKITGKPLISKDLDSDYIKLFKEKGIKIKEEIIKQPSFTELGLSQKNAINTDIKIEDLLTFYQKKYGEIILEPCDFETKFYEESKCKTRTNKKIYEEIIMNARNNSIITHIINEKKSKIAIIYGKEHFIAVKDSLQKLGYKLIN